MTAAIEPYLNRMHRQAQGAAAGALPTLPIGGQRVASLARPPSTCLNLLAGSLPAYPLGATLVVGPLWARQASLAASPWSTAGLLAVALLPTAKATDSMAISPLASMALTVPPQTDPLAIALLAHSHLLASLAVSPDPPTAMAL
jgi:hypothetical protein